LKLSHIAKTFIQYQVKDGSKIFLWYDHWHPARYLLDKYGFQVVYDSGFSKEAKLSSILLEGDWFWRSTRSKDLVAIQSKLPEITIGDTDKPIWHSSRGSYSCAEV
jgi:hypothetical protein